MEMRTLKGILTASDWDKDGSIIGISLETGQEETFKISPFNPDLIENLQNLVEVEGLVSVDTSGNFLLSVCDCRELVDPGIRC